MQQQRDIGYLLHARDYRETSQLLDFFTLEHGRVRCVAKGIKNRKKEQRPTLFQPYLLAWAGAHDLKTLRSHEAAETAAVMTGTALFAGLYINELLMRLLPELDPHPELYPEYQMALAAIALNGDVEPGLRRFECNLLEALGYAVSLSCDADSGDQIGDQTFYRVVPDHGAIAVTDSQASRPDVYRGTDLLAIEAGDFSAADYRRAAKRLLRQLIDHHLEGRQLHSRELFIQFKQGLAQ